MKNILKDIMKKDKKSHFFSIALYFRHEKFYPKLAEESVKKYNAVKREQSVFTIQCFVAL